MFPYSPYKLNRTAALNRTTARGINTRPAATLLGILLIGAVVKAGATSVTLAWNPSSGTGIAGYHLHQGVASLTYTNQINVGNVTNATVSGLTQGVTYYFAVSAYDTAGLESADSTEVSYTPPVTPPAIVLTAPANGATYSAPASIALAATVTPNGHTITSVQFYSGATLLGQSATAPYAWTWGNVAAGSYNLSAKAIYDAGSTVASSSASISVTNAVTNTPLPAIVLTAPANGATYSAPASVALAATVTPNGHTITSVQFYSGATILGQSTTAPYAWTWGNVAAGSYNLSAKAVYDAGSSVASSSVGISVTNAVTNAPAPVSLPAPWQAVDIGSTGLAGNSYASNALFVVSGAGTIAGTSDTFRFVYQPLTGDGQITAQLNSLKQTGASGCASVMIRESLAAGSRYALMGVSTSDTFISQHRNKTNFKTWSTTAGSGIPPQAWVRLVRSGSSFTGYESTDGVNWTQVNSASISMASNIYIGLVVSSGSTSVLNTSVFNNLNVVP